MAYLILTERCNMSCLHCCVSATKHGRDMSEEVFRNALEWCRDADEIPFLGGGEPTIHPKFWEFVGILFSMRTNWWPGGDTAFGIITNGSQTGTACTLAGMAKGGVIYAALSRDEWHDSIDQVVVEAFRRGRRELPYPYSQQDGDQREIRHSKTILRRGRAVTQISGTLDECCCPELTVDPVGNIWSCGCKVEKFGTVLEPDIADDYHDRDDPCGMKLQRVSTR